MAEARPVSKRKIRASRREMDGPASLKRVSTFDERRRARAAWPIRRVTLWDEALTDETLTDERIPEDPDARVAMVVILTRAQWPLSGAELPRYTRAEIPGRIIRPAR